MVLVVVLGGGGWGCRWGPVGKRERWKTSWERMEEGGGWKGGSANNTALIIPWTCARMFLCLL